MPTPAPSPLNYAPARPSYTPSPWRWVPVLFFMQALPNALATAVFPIVFKSLDIPNLTITAWTPLVALPWTLKLLWAPLVDITARKRTWVSLTQFSIFALTLLAATGLLLPQPFYPVLAVLLLLAICSATHDIAADGLYLLSLDSTQQASFVGVLTTAARLGKLLATGLLVYFAGFLTSHFRFSTTQAWAISLAALSALYLAGTLLNVLFLPRSPADTTPHEAASPATPRPSILPDLTRTLFVIATGAALYTALSSAVRLLGHAYFTLTHRVPDWQQSPLALLSWAIAGAIAAVLLPPLYRLSRARLRNTPIGTALSTYLTQPGFAYILFFILTYRLGEAMVSAMTPLFFKDTRAAGGLALTLEDIGAISGIAGMLGIILGGLVGGYFISRLGLRRAFWPLAICMHTPNLLYIYAAHQAANAHAVPLYQLYAITFVDMFGYGFGFAGYFVYLMQVAQRSHNGLYRTTHYAIGTGLGALTILLATALSGIIYSALGYQGFFIAVCALTIPGMLSLLFIPILPQPKTPAPETP